MQRIAYAHMETGQMLRSSFFYQGYSFTHGSDASPDNWLGAGIINKQEQKQAKFQTCRTYICIKQAQYRTTGVLYGRNPAVRYIIIKPIMVFSSKGFPDSNIKGPLMHVDLCVFIVTETVVLFYRMISIINNME